MPSLLHRSVKPRGEGFDEGIPFRTECSVSVRCSGVGLCISSHLQEEASLLITDPDSDLWVEQNVDRRCLNAVFGRTIIFGSPLGP